MKDFMAAGKAKVNIGGVEKEVTIEDVSEPNSPGPAIILLDCPDDFDS